MTDAREVIAKCVSGPIECPCVVNDEPCKDCAELGDTITAALAAAGLAIVDRSKFKPKLNAKSMKYLDDMAEAEEAMAGKPALRLLLEHYRAMVEAATDE